MTRKDIGLMTLSGLILIFSFPPFWGGPIAMTGLIPLFYLIEGKKLKKAFLGGYVIGFIWTSGTLYWIGWPTITGMIGSVLYVPVFTGLFTAILCWIYETWGRQALWFAPFLWTAIELIQSFGVLGFPWNQLANTQTHMTGFIQFASIFGSYGVSFWIVLLNVLIFYLIQYFGRNRKTWMFALFLLLILAVPWFHSQFVLQEKKMETTGLNVSLIQGNIDPYKKWTPSFVDSNFVVYQHLSETTAATRPGLIVWPETATPCYLRYRFQYLSKVLALVDSLNAPILTGAPDYQWNQQGKADVYNAALLLEPENRRIQRYYKINLVPFSERVPLVDRLPSFYDWLSSLHLDVGRYTPGDSTYIFKVYRKHQADYQFATAICFDSVFPFQVRDMVKKGAEFLVIITNDGWFGHTSGPYQHAQIAVIRAIETGRWIARCANTGISGFIDPQGRYRKKSRFHEETVLHETVSLIQQQTFFVRYGDVLKYIVIICNLFILMWTLKKRAYNRNGQSERHQAIPL